MVCWSLCCLSIRKEISIYKMIVNQCSHARIINGWNKNKEIHRTLPMKFIYHSFILYWLTNLSFSLSILRNSSMSTWKRVTVYNAKAPCGHFSQSLCLGDNLIIFKFFILQANNISIRIKGSKAQSFHKKDLIDWNIKEHNISIPMHLPNIFLNLVMYCHINV